MRNRALQFVAALAEPAEKGVVRIPLAVTGTWVRGDQQFSITRRDLESIARNFAGRQNREINVDYDHASEMPEVAAGGPIPSAGRIVGVEKPASLGANSDGAGMKPATPRLILWGWYEPTSRARELIRRREYRYISPAIDWGARSKRTGQAQGATLTSVALTNRPFLEELPQIHLSDLGVGARGSVLGVRYSGRSANDLPAGRVNSQPPETASGKLAAAKPGSDISNSRSQQGGSMKKVQVSAAPQDPDTAGRAGKIMVGHPDFADEYYADPDEVRQVLMDMGLAAPDTEENQNGASGNQNDGDDPQSRHTGTASGNQNDNGEPDGDDVGDAREISLSQAAAVLSEAEARGKAIPAAEFFRARVEQSLDEAVKAGKILPRQRQDWRRIALADFPTFSKLMGEQPQRIPLKPLGFSGSAPVDVPTQVKFLAEQRMRERGVSFGQALTEIGREQPTLMHEYRKAVSGQ